MLLFRAFVLALELRFAADRHAAAFLLSRPPIQPGASIHKKMWMRKAPRCLRYPSIFWLDPGQEKGRDK